MENLDTNDLIERYLDGSLPEEDRQAVETRLASDAAFRAEVELQRQLHAEFADPQKLRLRNLMSDIVRESPPPAASYGWWKGLGLSVLLLIVAWLAWHWYTANQEQPVAPTKQQEIHSPIPTEQIDTPALQNVPTESVKKDPQPIAMANPADFAVNREFEDRLGSMIRSTGGSVEMLSPRMGEGFTPANGLVKITFRGTAPASADDAQYPLILKIYSNQGASKPPKKQILPPILHRDNAEQWTFSIASKLALPPGLYYYTLERQVDEDLIFVGKFTVGRR